MTCKTCGKTPCESKVYCHSVDLIGFRLIVGPEGQPMMTKAQAEAYMENTNADGLTWCRDNTGTLFLAINRGVSDDGTGIMIDVIAQIVAEPEA